MKDKLGIGIVGLGNIAPVHAEAVQQAHNAGLVSFYSSNKNKVYEFASKYNAKGFSDWDEFVNDEELDIISICTPSGTHLDYGKKVAEAGKHIIIEKPIEVNIARANLLIQICKKNGVQLAVIYQNRFLPEVEKLKKIIDENKLGKIFLADAYVKWYRSQEYYDSGEWRGTLNLDGGGVLINQAIHTIDLIYHLVGDVDSIFAKTATLTHSNIEGEDNAVLVMNYKNGALGVFEASTSIQLASPRRIEIHGENGTAILNGDDLEITINGKKIEGGKTETKEAAGAADPLAGFTSEPHKKQFEQIVNAFLNGKEPIVSGEESLRSLGIVNAAYESAKLNLPINFDEFMKNNLI